MRKERMCGEAQGNVLGGEGEEAVVVLVALVDAFEEDGLGGMMALRISCTMRGGPRISELPESISAVTGLESRRTPSRNTPSIGISHLFGANTPVSASLYIETFTQTISVLSFMDGRRPPSVRIPRSSLCESGQCFAARCRARLNICLARNPEEARRAMNGKVESGPAEPMSRASSDCPANPSPMIPAAPSSSTCVSVSDMAAKSWLGIVRFPPPPTPSLGLVVVFLVVASYAGLGAISTFSLPTIPNACVRVEASP